MGLQRIISSTSIAIRFRSSIVVGTMKFSASEIVGNTTAVPPAAVTPLFTDSARSRSPMLQGLSSLQLEQIPMIGRRRTASLLNPPARRKARSIEPRMITGEVITVDRRPASSGRVPWVCVAACPHSRLLSSSPSASLLNCRHARLRS